MKVKKKKFKNTNTNPSPTLKDNFQKKFFLFTDKLIIHIEASVSDTKFYK